MIVVIFVTFLSTTLSSRDGFGRMLGNGLRLVAEPFGASERWRDERRLRRNFTLVVLAAAPVLVYWLFGRSVTLLKLAGAVEAGNIPGKHCHLTFGQLALPAITALVALFFAAFAALYLLQLSGVSVA